MRIPKLASLLGLFLFACIFAPTIAAKCGQERWPVKVAQDDHVKYFYKNRDIDGGELVNAINTTVAKLSSKAWPFDWEPKKKPQQWSYTLRHGQAEFTLWRLKTRIMEKKNEADEDYHLVLQSGLKQMIAEIPSPNCVEDTPEPLRSMIIQARENFDTWYAAQSPKKNMNKKIILEGLGFFDRVHGGTGQVLKNGIELHPVIKVEFPN